MLLTLNAGTVLIAQRTTSIPSGTEITIRTNEAIKTDAAQVATTQVYGGTVSENVVDSSSRILVPKGSAAQLAVVKESDSRPCTRSAFHYREWPPIHGANR